MPYKDKEKQKVAQKERTRRYRANHKLLQDSKREATRLRVARHRGNNELSDICEICGLDGIVDIHHEGQSKEVHILCPNCHALITRGIKTIVELKALHKRKDVTPKSVTPSVTPAINIPGIKPLGLPLSPTGSTCNSFETLPKDIQDAINRLSPEEGEGTGPPGISREQRIANAIHYQQYVRAD